MACEVMWSSPTTIAFTGRLPSIVRRSRFGPFVGREPERALLDSAFEVAHAGRPCVVLVAGEPGIGKTRLASEATAGWVQHHRALALAGACGPEVGPLYQPVIEALTQVLAVVAPEQVRTWAGPDASTLALVLPALGDEGAGDRLGDRREECFRAVEAVFVGLSAATTVVLVLEDLHWAPLSTLALVGHLVSSPAVTKLLVVITYRNTAPDLADEFRVFCGDLARSTNVVRLELNGLSAGDVASLLQVGADQECRDAAVDRAGQSSPIPAATPSSSPSWCRPDRRMTDLCRPARTR